MHFTRERFEGEGSTDSYLGPHAEENALVQITRDAVEFDPSKVVRVNVYLQVFCVPLFAEQKRVLNDLYARTSTMTDDC